MRCFSTVLRLAPVVLLASAAAAAEVGPCGELNRIDNLVGQVKTYSQGKIRVAHADTGGEPVCCSSHLLVLVPNIETGDGTLCFAVSDEAGRDERTARGFANIDLNRITSSYDPQHGLLLTVPYSLYDLKAGRPGRSAFFRVRIDLRDADPVTIER